MVLDAITGSKKTTLADAVVVLWWLLDIRLTGTDSTEYFFEIVLLNPPGAYRYKLGRIVLNQWQGKKDSNLRMLESKSSALTGLAIPLRNSSFCRRIVAERHAYCNLHATSKKYCDYDLHRLESGC